jgi:holo-[acyl-carrier protein] synthase
MIYGVGIDLVRVSRMEKVIQRWGGRFVERVFTPDEAALCERRRSFSAYALRFAAKEAFSKALGLGMTNGLKWREIEVYHERSGRPGLHLYGRADELRRFHKINRVHLSLSDEGDYGVAVVVLDRVEGEAPAA